MSKPPKYFLAMAAAVNHHAKVSEPKELHSATIGRLMADGQHAVSPHRRRDLMLAARAAALDQFLIPIEAIRDEQSLQAFLKVKLDDCQLLSLTLLKSRIPRQQLQAQHPDVLRALEQADVLTTI
jgi:hypothetical protein